MQVRKIFLFISCFFICSSEIISQQYPFINYTPVDGLVNNRVRSMYQDSKGRLYFLTFAGISVYDGARFINYSQAEGLSLPVVNDILEITPDSFLVATNTAELYALVHGKIKRLSSKNEFYPVINHFFKSENGTIYIAADEGLFVWQNDLFNPLPLYFNGKETAKYLVQIKEAGNFLILLSNPGLGEDAGAIWLFDRLQKKVVFKQNGILTNYMTISPEGDIWMIGNTGVRVFKKEMLMQGLLREAGLPKAFSTIKHKKGSFITFDSQGQLWFSNYDEGIFLIKPWASPISFTESSGLGSTRISFIFHDKEGNNWFLPEGKGAQKLMNYNLEFIIHPFGISAITDLYANSHSDSVWFYNELTGQLILSNGEHEKKFSPPLKKNLGTVHIIAKGPTVFLYNEKNIYSLAVSRGSLLEVNHHYQDSSRQTGNGAIDPNGNLIYCTDKFVSVFFENKTIYKHPLGYYGDQIAFDQKGRLWITPRSNKVLVFSLHPEDHDHYLKLEYDLSSQINFKNPRSLAIDARGYIWIGTRFDGLYCFQFTNTRLKQQYHLTRKEGLTDNFINYLGSYKDSSIWASSPAGLDKLQIINHELVIDNITQSNNLFLSIKKIMTDNRGTSWGVGESGILLKEYKNRRNNSSFIPKLYISEIKTDKETYTNSDSIHDFSYHHNTLLFSLAAPSFYDEKEIKYSYLLDGSGSHQWSEPSPNAELNFVNLPAGSYTLKVKATFPAKRYNSQLFSYAFQIHPPWWQTLWFYFVVSLIALGVLLFGVRSYYRQKFIKQRSALEKQQLIEKERTRIATDMHDDLGAGLSRIKYLSESIQLKKENDESISNDVIKIADYSDEMVEKMGEIVWALNEKNDTLADLVAFTRSYSVDYLSNHNIECKFITPEILPVSFVTGEIRRNIFLSVKESLHNIIKHARAANVTIRITIDKTFQVEIHDDGVGIDYGNIRPYSNGLTNIKKRMEEVGGGASFENTQGTKVILNVPFQ